METDVTRMLNDAGIPYTPKPHAKPVYTCEDAARERGVRVSQIVKCMVGKDPKGEIHVMLIPGDKTLKIKKARQLAGGIRIELISPEKLAQEHGLTVGAISPTQFLGKARFYMDNSVFEEENIDISSGNPDAGVELKAEALCSLLGARCCDIISTSGGQD